MGIGRKLCSPACLVTSAVFLYCAGTAGQTYSDDSLIVKAILDSNGLDTVPVEHASQARDGRIVVLSLRQDFQAKVLPECVGQMTALEVIHATYNKLRFLPTSIGDLHNLQHMFIGGNLLARPGYGLLGVRRNSPSRAKPFFFSRSTASTLLAQCLAFQALALW